jgi:prevent-host-death family protein
MKIVVGINEAQTKFSQLVKRVERGAEVIVKRGDRPVVKIVRYAKPAMRDRKPGLLAGQIAIKPDFDELPPGFQVFGD